MKELTNHGYNDFFGCTIDQVHVNLVCTAHPRGTISLSDGSYWSDTPSSSLVLRIACNAQPVLRALFNLLTRLDDSHGHHFSSHPQDGTPHLGGLEVMPCP